MIGQTVAHYKILDKLGEGQSRSNHVILVTNWFDALREILPGS